MPAMTLSVRYSARMRFALTLVGAFATFLPMHVLGLAGMPRRIHTYPAAMGWGGLNLLATLGSLVLAGAGVVFAVALFRARSVASEPSRTGGEIALPGTPGPALAAGGLALLAMGTLLGWLAGVVGGGLLAVGAWRMARDWRG